MIVVVTEVFAAGQSQILNTQFFMKMLTVED